MPNESFNQHNNVLSIFITTIFISILVTQNGGKINENLKLQNAVPLQLLNIEFHMHHFPIQTQKACKFFLRNIASKAAV